MANPGPPLESPLPPVGTVLLVNNWISLCYKVSCFRWTTPMRDTQDITGVGYEYSFI